MGSNPSHYPVKQGVLVTGFTVAFGLADFDLTKNTAFFAPASLHNYEVHKRKTAIIMTFMEATLEASVKAVLEVIVEAPPLCTAAEGGDCCCRLLFVFPAELNSQCS